MVFAVNGNGRRQSDIYLAALIGAEKIAVDIIAILNRKGAVVGGDLGGRAAAALTPPSRTTAKARLAVIMKNCLKLCLNVVFCIIFSFLIPGMAGIFEMIAGDSENAELLYCGSWKTRERGTASQEGMDCLQEMDGYLSKHRKSKSAREAHSTPP